MRIALAAGVVLAAGLPATAGVPPMVPLLPPGFIEALPQPEPPLGDPVKLAERIEANTKAAAGRLADRDPGPDARKAQWQALQDIDELLKQAENSPPPPMGGGGDGSPPPPMGNDGGGQPPPPPGGGQPPPPGGGGGKPPPPGGEGKHPPGKQPGGGQPGGGQPMPSGGQQPMPAGPGDQSQAGGQQAGANPGGGQGGKATPASPLDDRIAKQVWGHLPDTVRKQMSQYYQEQFMPRYNGLLRDYFSSLAEREKGSPPDRSPKR